MLTVTAGVKVRNSRQEEDTAQLKRGIQPAPLKRRTLPAQLKRGIQPAPLKRGTHPEYTEDLRSTREEHAPPRHIKISPLVQAFRTFVHVLTNPPVTLILLHTLYKSITALRGFPSLLSTKGRGFHLNGSANNTVTYTRYGELHPPHVGGRENSLDPVCVPLTPCNFHLFRPYINTYTHQSHCVLLIAQYHAIAYNSLSGGIRDLEALHSHHTLLTPPTKAHLYLYFFVVVQIATPYCYISVQEGVLEPILFMYYLSYILCSIRTIYPDMYSHICVVSYTVYLVIYYQAIYWSIIVYQYIPPLVCTTLFTLHMTPHIYILRTPWLFTSYTMYTISGRISRVMNSNILACQLDH